MPFTEIADITDNARYSDTLDELLEELGAVKMLSLEFESDYQGFVDVDCLLNDGRIYSYRYDYGSCCQCDEWEYRNLTETEIKQVMLQEATFFDNIDQYNKWRKTMTHNEEELRDDE